MAKRKEFSASSGTSKTYQRSAWKHIIRWLAFLFIVALDLAVLASMVKSHYIIPPGQTVAQLLLREAIGLSMIGFFHLLILPSIVLEANKVEVTPDRLILDNLLFRSKIKWEDIVAFKQPRILKFAILRTKKFFHLLNRRDLERYDELAETIEHKAVNLIMDQKESKPR